MKNMRGVGGERDFELVFPAGSDKIVQSRARDTKKTLIVL